MEIIGFTYQIKNMRFIKFTEAKKAPKKLLRPARSANVATKQVVKSMAMGAGRKGLLWQEQGMSTEGMKNKMEAFGVKLKNKKRELAKRINDNYQKNYLKPNSPKKVPLPSVESVIAEIKKIQQDTELDLANKKIDKTVDNFNKAVQSPSNVVNSPKNSVPQVINPNTSIKPKGGGKGLLIGAGIAGAAVIGGLGYGLYRKTRSDKGKKRGSYKNFNFPGQLTKF